MIFIHKKYLDNRDAPPSLSNTNAQNKLALLQAKEITTDSIGRNDYGKDEVTNRLKAYSLDKFELEPMDEPKCYYCESYSEHVAPLQVEHFRPKKKVSPEDTNGKLHEGYYWLTLDWHNLLLACSTCNGRGAKGTRFPISGTRATTPNCDLEGERHLLINPEIEDPEPYLTFNIEGNIFGTGDRETCKGHISISIYNLDRDLLVIRRKKIWKEFEGEIKEAAEYVESNPDEKAVLKILFKRSIKRIILAQNPGNEYSLWNRFINKNLETLVNSIPMKTEYKDLFLKLYNMIKSEEIKSLRLDTGISSIE